MSLVPLTPNGHHRPVPIPPAAALILASGVVLAVAALVVHPGVTAETPTPILAGGGALVVLAALLSLKLPASRALGVSVLAWMGFVAWGAASVGGSLDRHLSEVALLGWLGGVGVLASFALGTPISRLWRAGAGALVGAALVLSAWALFQGLPEFWQAALHDGSLPRLKATFTNADCFAAILVGALLLAAGLVAGAGPAVGYGLMAGSGLLLATLLLTGSRSALAGTVAGFALFAALLLSRRDEEGTRSTVLGLAAPVLMALLLLLGNFLVPALGRWGLLLSEEGQQGVSMRFAVATYGLQNVADRPLRGSGPGTFHLAFQEHRPPGIRLYVNVAHNDYMQAAVETGIPGFLLFLAGLAIPLLRASGCARRGPFPAESAAAAGAGAGLAVYATLNFALPVPADLFWWCAILGLCLSDSLSRERPHPVPRLAVAPVALVLALAGGAALVVGLRLDEAARLARRAEHLSSRLRWEEAAELAGQAHAADPLDPAHLARLSALEERMARHAGKPEGLQKALDLLREAHALSPSDVLLRVDLARLMRETGDGEGAERLLLETRDSAPNDLRVQASLADVYLRRGQLPEAAEALWQAGAISRNVIRPLGRLVAFLEQRAAGDGAAPLRRWAADPDRREEALSVAREASESLAREGKLDPAGRLLALRGELEPGDLCVLLQTADLALTRKKTDEALALLQKAMESEGSEGEENAACRRTALERWTGLMIQENLLDAAEERLRTALEARAWESDTRALLADVLEARGDEEAAGKLLRDGLSRSPGDPALLVRMGRFYESRGATDAAIRCYRDALRRAPEDPEITNALRRLEGKKP